MRRTAGWALVGAILFGAAAAQASHRSIAAQACAQYRPVDAALIKLRSVGPDTRIGDLRSAESQLRSSYERFAATAEQVAQPQVARLDDRIGNLYKTMDNMPADATGDQARAMIRGDIARIQVAKKQLLTSLGCPNAGPNRF